MPASHYSLIQLINWIPTSPLIGPFESGGRVVGSSHFQLHQQLWNAHWHQQTVTAVTTTWPRPELPSLGGWVNSVSKLTPLPPGTARPCHLGVDHTHAAPTSETTMDNQASGTLSPVLLIYYQHTTSFCRIFLSKAQCPGGRRNYLRLTRDFIPTKPFPHGRPLMKQLESRGQSGFSTKCKVCHICTRIRTI